jgi:hypothetical protein
LTSSPHHHVLDRARVTPTTSAPTLPTPTTPAAAAAVAAPAVARVASIIPGPQPTTTTTVSAPIPLPPPDTQGPTITGLYAAPLPVCISGSTTTTVVYATVTDPSGIASVTVTIVAPDGTTTKPMTGPGTYRAVVGPFSAPSPPDVTWVVRATDAIGNQSAVAGTPITILTGC